MLKYLGFVFILFIAYVLIAVNAGWDSFIFTWVEYVPYKDKTIHFFLIGLLAFFVNIILNCKQIRLGSIDFLLGSSLVFLFVTLEEGSQFFLENRTCDFFDLLANYAGIFVFGKLAVQIVSMKKKTVG